MTPAFVWSARALGRLSVADVLLLIEAQLALMAAQVARSRRPIGQLLGVASATGPPPSSHGPQLSIAMRVGTAITRAARYGVFQPHCLVRSLALQRMLRRRGIDGSELRIGTRLEHGAFQAHAWVELGGRVIGDDPHHVRMFSPASDMRLVQL